MDSTPTTTNNLSKSEAGMKRRAANSSEESNSSSSSGGSLQTAITATTRPSVEASPATPKMNKDQMTKDKHDHKRVKPTNSKLKRVPETLEEMEADADQLEKDFKELGDEATWEKYGFPGKSSSSLWLLSSCILTQSGIEHLRRPATPTTLTFEEIMERYEAEGIQF